MTRNDIQGTVWETLGNDTLMKTKDTSLDPEALEELFAKHGILLHLYK